ncbi:hypothetical protein HZA97_09645 [Candidatus Woesearchaeota archaeon]|nr:hypothetical protein [Candidatus Woesearchaeota archaeon]
MEKRGALEIQLLILKIVHNKPGITFSELERKVGTNPTSLKQHCDHLEYFNLVKILREPKTRKLVLTKNGEKINKKNKKIIF